MDLTIKEIILILLITFPATIHCKDSCPNSSCGSSFFPIKYPFKLETDEPPINCYNSINLRCDDHGHTVINLPHFGDFYVNEINYYRRIIALTYPENCLPGMLMTNFSVSPLAAFSIENYTFYMCNNEDLFTRRFEIQCLSNSTNATVVVTRDSSGYVEGLIGCKPIVSSMIPVPLSNEYNDWQNFNHLELTWNSPGCQHCELLYDHEKQGESKSKLAKLITGSTVFIPLAVILTTFFSVACFIRFLKLIAGGTTTTENTADGNGQEGRSATTTVARPPAGGPTNAEASKVESFSQVVVLEEGHQDSALMCCSICLEEYRGKDRVRSLGQCGHLFHAGCIDQWLLKSNSCPMCRTSLFVF